MTILGSGASCSAAQALAGQRFLSAQAPILPLDDCDRRHRCDCRYQRFADRRKGPRRRSEGALPSTRQATLEEKRTDQGRRTEELGVSGAPRPWLK